MIETIAPGGLITDATYDGAGRLTDQTTGYGSTLQEVKTDYDADSNAILTATSQMQLNADMSTTANELISAPNGDVAFRGMTVQVQEDISHLSIDRLERMAEFGTSPLNEEGQVITLHHVNQDPAGPLWEIPGPLNDVNNLELHPYGNTRGAGLSLQQRAAFNTWRTNYWQARAIQELGRRGF